MPSLPATMKTSGCVPARRNKSGRANTDSRLNSNPTACNSGCWSKLHLGRCELWQEHARPITYYPVKLNLLDFFSNEEILLLIQVFERKANYDKTNSGRIPHAHPAHHCAGRREGHRVLQE